MAEIVSNQIPQDLKQIQAWVFWKFKQFPDEKKPRKIPYNPKTCLLYTSDAADE